MPPALSFVFSSISVVHSSCCGIFLFDWTIFVAESNLSLALFTSEIPVVSFLIVLTSDSTGAYGLPFVVHMHFIFYIYKTLFVFNVAYHGNLLLWRLQSEKSC